MHIGQAQLSLDRTVLEGDHRVDDALRMDENFNVIGHHAKQPARLDHLKALVHHRCRIDGDFGTHRPVGMLQCVGCSNRLELFLGQRAERATRRREQQLVDILMALADQALVKSAMLAVNGIEHAVRVLHQTVNQLTSNHQGLLVGQSDAFARTDSCNRRLQPTVAHHGGHHGVNLGGRNSLCNSGAACSDLDAGTLERIANVLVILLVGNDDHLGAHEPRLRNQQVGTAACHK